MRFGIFVVAIATAKFHFEECEALKLSLKTGIDAEAWKAFSAAFSAANDSGTGRFSSLRGVNDDFSEGESSSPSGETDAHQPAQEDLMSSSTLEAQGYSLLTKEQKDEYDLVGPSDNPRFDTVYSSHSPEAEAVIIEQKSYHHYRYKCDQSLAFEDLTSAQGENHSINYNDDLFKSLESLFKDENVDMYGDLKLNAEVKSLKKSMDWPALLKNNVNLSSIKWDGAPVWTTAVINGQYIHTLFAFSLNSEHKARLFKFKIVHHSDSEVQMKNFHFNFDYKSVNGPSGTMSFVDSKYSQQKKFNILYPLSV